MRTSNGSKVVRELDTWLGLGRRAYARASCEQEFATECDHRGLSGSRTIAAIAGNVDAQLFLGRMFAEGKGFSVEIRNAIYRVSRAANNGSEKAKKELKLLKEIDEKIKAGKLDASEISDLLDASEISDLIKKEIEENQTELDRIVEKLKEPKIFWGLIALGVLLLFIYKILYDKS